MHGTFVVFKRELLGYFSTPIAYVFIFFFLILLGALSFWMGDWFAREQADLQGFFGWHPWLYLILVPGVAMPQWSEERKSGTIELLLTMPISMTQAVVGKFLAAWAFIGFALALTFPAWITVTYLGQPDHGVILASYIGSFLMAGGFLAVGTFCSALTSSQAVAFVLAVFVSALLTIGGYAVSWMQPVSFYSHFVGITRGVIDARDVIFFGSVVVAFLLASAIVVDTVKAR